MVALDGSAGSGKSTTARAVAARLGFRHLDSGALYRAVTFALLDAGRGGGPGARGAPLAVGAISEAAAAAALRDLPVALRWSGPDMTVLLRGAPVPDEALRGDRVTAAVSSVAAMQSVRDHLLGLQRSAAEPPGLVAEGRDMASVVFPGAAVKVFLDADPLERARRRILQRGGEADADAVEEEAERLRLRDLRDASRAIAPLVRDPDAVTLDTTGMEPAGQIERVVRLALASRARSGYH